MIYSKIAGYRYAYIALISIFSITTLFSQQSPSEALKDSLDYMDPYPSDEEALILYQKLYRMSKEEGNRDVELYSKIFTSYFNDAIGNNILSDEETEEVAQMVQDTSGLSSDNIMMAYQWIQQLERRRGNLIKANELIKKYIELELRNGVSDVEIGISYLELGSSYRILGDFENALLYPTKALQMFENAPDSLFKAPKDRFLRYWRALQIRGLTKKDLKDYNGAINDYELSINHLEKSAHLQSDYGKKSSIKSYARLAQVYLLNKDVANASKTLNKLAPLVRKNPYHKYLYHEHSARLALLSGDLNSAPNHLDKAIKLANEELKGSKAYPEIARLEMIYGDYFKANGMLQNALEKYHKGLQYFDNTLNDYLLNNPDINTVSEGGLTLQLLEKKANTFRELYGQDEDINALYYSISTFDTAIELIDKLKTDFINEGSKYRVNDIASSIYPQALEANYTLYLIEDDKKTLNNIFKVIEKNKAEILFQNVSSKYNLLSSALPKDVIKKGIDLQYNISYYSKLLSEEVLKDEKDKSKIGKYEDKLFKLNEELSFHDQNIKDNYPDYYSFKSSLNNQIQISLLQHALTEGEVLIEYFQTRQHMYALTIWRDKVRISKTPLSKIESEIATYYDNISNPPTSGSNSVEELEKASISLGKSLLSASINFFSDFDKLIIVTDGILNSIPFEPLIINKEGKMLIEHCNVAYNYSADQYFKNNFEEPLTDPQILSLTPSFEGIASDQRTCNATILGDLPYAKEEFDFIQSKFKGKFYQGASANSENLKANIADYPIIHLATHACVNEDNPMLNQIFFSDGALTSYDIQNLNSRPELVMLSACNTASGEVIEGEGVIGLSRGFFEAGVKGVQSSLWSINDKSSSEIVKNVYRYLKEGKSKSEALRTAKLDYLEKADKLRAHPYYWAALIHLGNDNPIKFTSNKGLYLFLGVLALLFILLFFFRFKSK